VIIRQCLADGLPLPERMQNAPRLWLGLELYWQAFWDLTTCRTSGWSVAPIPWSAMKEYAEVLELDDEQRESMFYLVRAMDNAYMDFRARKKE
jgi:hypothetical protein